MFKHKKFHYQDAQVLRQDIEQMKLNMPFAELTEILKQPLLVGEKTVPNRLAVHPMEGCDGTEEGRPSELIYRRYDRFARGGAGLLWFEATAVVPEGRANPRQLLLTKETMPEFKLLLEKTLLAARAEYGETHKPYTVIQLTHSGRYSKPGPLPEPIIALNIPELDGRLPLQYKIISDEELELLEDKYVEAAQLAAEAGFDAVDIKACHRYLINELLGGHAREGRYGGTFENRIRFICNVVDKVRDRLGDRIAIAVRMNAYDALSFPSGWGVDRVDWHTPDFSEPAKLARILCDKGVKIINVTAGNPYYNPHVNRPFDIGYYTPPYHPLENVAVILQAAQAIQTAVPEAAVIATGFTWMRHLAGHIAAGGVEQKWFALAGFGRQAFAYPDFAKDLLIQNTMDPKKVCITCGQCSVIMRDGGKSGCVIRDSSVYAPIYRAGREGKPPIDGTKLAEHV